MLFPMVYGSKPAIIAPETGVYRLLLELNMNFSEKLRLDYSKELFSEQDLKILYPNMSQSSLHSGISRSLRSKDIIKLKRGHYMFAGGLQQKRISKFVIASHLYNPSYISFESALSYHGLIPEAVYVTTSACKQRKYKKFNSVVGDFSYDFIPCVPFFIGVEAVTINEYHCMLANPIKALFDLIYKQRKHYNSLTQIESNLRIEKDLLLDAAADFTEKEIQLLAESYKKNTVKNLSHLLIKERS